MMDFIFLMCILALEQADRPDILHINWSVSIIQKVKRSLVELTYLDV